MLVSYDLRLTVGGIPQKQGLGCSGSSRGHLSVLFLYHYPKPLNYGHPSLCISLKEKDVAAYSVENYAHSGIQ